MARILTILALALCAFLISLPLWAAPPLPDSEDAQVMAGHEEWIKGQYTSGGQYCCDLSDGRPADIRRTKDGGYEVFYSREHWPDGTGKWLVVPASAILRQQSPIYSPIAWILYGRVYCLALAGAS